MRIIERMTTRKTPAHLCAALLALAVLCMSPIHIAQAADITCADRWSETTPGFDEGVLKERFPSGRKPTTDSCRAIYISGDIISGDDARFLQLLQQNHPFISTVIISSRGGDVQASVNIGRLVRKYLLLTVVPSLPQNIAVYTGRLEVFPGGFVSDGQRIGTGLRSGPNARMLCDGSSCLCASACTNIWAAGSLRYGNFLGVHQAYTEKMEDRQNLGLSPAMVKRPQQQAIDYTLKYLADMEIPASLTEKLANTSPDGVSWVPPEDMRRLTYPASTMSLLDDCRASLHPFECDMVKLSALRDALETPSGFVQQ